MKTNKFLSWLKTWDAGEFDFTAALHDRQAELNVNEGNRDHPWKLEPVNRLEAGEIRSFRRLYPAFAVILCCILIGFLLLTVEQLPAFGSADSPAHNEVMKRYVEKGMEETGAVNVVAGVILDYRAFDTLGESHVLYTATTAVFILLLSLTGNNDESEEDKKITQADPLLRSTARIVVPLVIVYGIYVIFNGHLGPGGGFAGGSVIGGGLILYALAFGFEPLDKVLNLKVFRIVVLCALCFYSFAKCYSFFCGANHLETIFKTGIPGRIFSAGLIMPLNVAVGTVVACTMYGFYSIFQRGKI